MRTKFVLIFSLFLVCFSQRDTEIDQGKIQSGIRAVLDAQVTAWNTGNIDAFMEGYHRSEKMRFVSSSGASYGWEPVRDRYKNRYPDKKTMGTLGFSELDVSVLSNDAALVFGRWRLKREEDEPGGLFTLLFRKIESDWRIVHDHTSSFKTD
jgi:ketosteroid isomerase-like protein